MWIDTYQQSRKNGQHGEHAEIIEENTRHKQILNSILVNIQVKQKKKLKQLH